MREEIARLDERVKNAKQIGALEERLRVAHVLVQKMMVTLHSPKHVAAILQTITKSLHDVMFSESHSFTEKTSLMSAPVAGDVHF